MISLLPPKEKLSLSKILLQSFLVINPKDNEHTPLIDCVKDANVYPGGDKRILIP